MTPSDIRAYFKLHPTLSLADLAVRFGSEPDVVRDVLGYWQRKGKVVELTGETCRKACSGCSAAKVTLYEWRD